MTHDELLKFLRLSGERSSADGSGLRICDEAADAIEQLQRDNAALMEDAAAQIQIAREAVERAAGLEAKLAAMEAQLEIPDYAMPPDGQEWALIGSAVAYHLIERHAENWAHAGQLMDAWRDATVFVADHTVAKDALRYRWLRRQAVAVRNYASGNPNWEIDWALRGESFEAAIDAARTQTERE